MLIFGPGHTIKAASNVLDQCDCNKILGANFDYFALIAMEDSVELRGKLQKATYCKICNMYNTLWPIFSSIPTLDS